jgi:hypothetical protein
MMLRALKFPGIFTLASILLAGCSSGDAPDMTTSWLGPLHAYERVSGADDDGVFVLRDGKPVAAERIILAPAGITVSVDSDLSSITPRAYERICAAFADALVRELSKQPNDTSADSDAYIVRIALTNLTAKRIGKDIGAASLDDLKFSFEMSAIEAEFRNLRKRRKRLPAVWPMHSEHSPKEYRRGSLRRGRSCPSGPGRPPPCQRRRKNNEDQFSSASGANGLRWRRRLMRIGTPGKSNVSRIPFIR